MAQVKEIDLLLEPQQEGGFHVYASDLPGFHTQGDTLEEALVNAQEAIALYAESLDDPLS